MTDITIEPLSPERIDDYFGFFDDAAFRDHDEWAGCYCLFYHFDPAHECEFDDCPVSERRVLAEKWIKEGIICGYLAHSMYEKAGFETVRTLDGFSIVQKKTK